MNREKLISLVIATQAGDSSAINELFNAFYNDVYFFALKTCAMRIPPVRSRRKPLLRSSSPSVRCKSLPPSLHG